MEYELRSQIFSLYRRSLSVALESLSPIDIPTSGPSFAVKYSPRSPRFLVASDETGQIYMVDVAYPEQVKRHSLHANSIFDVNWTLDGSSILTASADMTVKIWDVEYNSSQSLCGHRASVKCVQNSPVSQEVFVSASRNDQLYIWDTRSGLSPVAEMPSKKKKTYAVSYTSFGLLENGLVVVSVESNSSNLKFWDIRNLQKKIRCLASINPKTHEGSHNYDNKGNSWVSVGTYERLVVSSMDNCVYVYPSLPIIDDAPPLLLSGVSSSFFVRSSMDPLGNFVASGSQSGNLIVWELETGKRRTFGNYVGEMNSVDWGPLNSMMLASTSDEGSFIIWDY